jgi:hypothetical protein
MHAVGRTCAAVRYWAAERLDAHASAPGDAYEPIPCVQTA